MGSLRDQLLKKGVVTKKQAKKARIEARLDKKKGVDNSSEIQEKINKQKAEEKKRTQELNKKIEAARKERESLARAVDIAHSQNTIERDAHIPYYFAIDDRIKFINVTNQQRELLARGYAAIVHFGGDCYSLIVSDPMQKVLELNPALVVCKHSRLAPDQELEDDAKGCA